MFPTGTVVLGAPVADHAAKLHVSEIRSIRSAVDSRRAEFSTGRMLAAMALDQLDFPVRPIPKGTSNEPVWPDGIVGSITHNVDICMVAVARDNTCAGIGIDVENCDVEVRDLSRMILRDDELGDFPSKFAGELNDRVRLAFSAKESIFKAVFPRAQRFIDFNEVSVSFELRENRFFARAPEDAELNRILAAGEGTYIYLDHLLATGFYLPKG